VRLTPPVDRLDVRAVRSSSLPLRMPAAAFLLYFALLLESWNQVSRRGHRSPRRS